MKKWLCCFTFIALCLSAKGQVITVGPTFHYYFTKVKPKVTLGLEGTFHFGVSSLGFHGLVLGMEGGNEAWYLYGELQAARTTASYNFYGLALGAYYKKEKEKESVGFQATGWGNVYFAGGDLRLRISREPTEAGVGLFAKLPIPLRQYGH